MVIYQIAGNLGLFVLIYVPAYRFDVFKLTRIENNIAIFVAQIFPGICRIHPGMAFFKAQQATLTKLPDKGSVLITVTDQDKQAILESATAFRKLGFTIKATAGTFSFLKENGVESELILKEHEGRPNITDAIKNGDIQLVINTPAGKLSAFDDSYIRKAAIRYKLPYITTPAAALAAAKGITALGKDQDGLKSLQEYHTDIEKQS